MEIARWCAGLSYNPPFVFAFYLLYVLESLKNAEGFPFAFRVLWHLAGLFRGALWKLNIRTCKW